jgi:CheY-like chemotaxis protein
VAYNCEQEEQHMNELVLVVDDEEKIARLARDYLEQSGFRVMTAGDGAAALAVARRATSSSRSVSMTSSSITARSAGRKSGAMCRRRRSQFPMRTPPSSPSTATSSTTISSSRPRAPARWFTTSASIGAAARASSITDGSPATSSPGFRASAAAPGRGRLGRCSRSSSTNRRALEKAMTG